MRFGTGWNYELSRRTYDRGPIKNTPITNEKAKTDPKKITIRKQKTGKETPGNANHAAEEMKQGF